MQPRDLTLIIPASGFSKRFGAADKLTAKLNGRPVADYAASLGAAAGFGRKIAVVPHGADARAQIFLRRGFEIVINAHPERGQRYSIHCGAVQAASLSGQDFNLCILLADMPLLPLVHVKVLAERAGEVATKTLYEGHSQPPAIFRGAAARHWLEPLTSSGSQSRGVHTEPLKLIPLSGPFGDDIDTPDDLARLEKYLQKVQG